MLVNGTNLSAFLGADFAPGAGASAGFDPAQHPGLWTNPHQASYFYNYNVPPEWLVGNVTEAVALWRSKTGWDGPSSWGEVVQAGGTAAGPRGELLVPAAQQEALIARRQLQRGGDDAAATQVWQLKGWRPQHRRPPRL